MPEAAKITVTLEPEIEDFVRKEVERGDFASASDCVQDLIRQQRERDLAR
jgi:antitoxin ParD1/3/4